MKYAVITMLETEMSPRQLVDEIRSFLEFEPSTHTTVHSIVVLIDDATEVAVYDRKEEK